MVENFKAQVHEVLGCFFSENLFSFEAYIPLDRYGREVIVYSSLLCKLAFYRSLHDGEVNCLVGTLESENYKFDGDGWFFLNSLLSRGREHSIEELRAAIPDAPRSAEEQLIEISDKLAGNFRAILEGLPKAV